MSRTELNHKVKELRELRRMAEEIAAEIEAITDTIKREMAVQGVDMIAGDDWSYLSRTDDNRITMITCITGKPDLRLMVQAKEI